MHLRCGSFFLRLLNIVRSLDNSRSFQMSSSQTTNSQKNSECPGCGCIMWLYRTKPNRPWYDERTFQCPRCLYVDDAVAKVAWVNPITFCKSQLTDFKARWLNNHVN